MNSWWFGNEVTSYAEAGYDTLPLRPGTKIAVAQDWPNRAPSEMWRDAPNDANIGLRCGGDLRLAVFDADDEDNPQTSQNLIHYLAGLGHDRGDYPVIETPGGGRHCYVTLQGDLPGHARHYSADFGTGEFRFGRGAYVAAPPSVIGPNTYRLIAGDFSRLPRLDVRDILLILSNQDTIPEDARPGISRKCCRLLKGEGIEQYRTRSEAEQAIILSLVNTGHDFESVLSLFVANPCAGKFRELYTRNQRKAAAWLKLSYDKARLFMESHESRGRQIARAGMAWAESHLWTGRTGLVDRAVFVAHATIACRSGCVEYGASRRSIAEAAHVAQETATKATYRLMSVGLLELSRPATWDFPNVYRLQCCELSHFLTGKYLGSGLNSQQGNHDAFRTQGLGKAAGQVFEELRKGEALTVREIAERTGRRRETVWRALKRMAQIVDPSTGEVIALVEQDGDTWRACSDVDLDRVALVVGTFGASRRQHERHARERAAYRRALVQGTAKNGSRYRDTRVSGVGVHQQGGGLLGRG